MAEQVNGFSKGIRKVHNWDEWLNGKIWRLTKTVDFNVSTRDFANAARRMGKRRNGKVRTNTVSPTVIEIQFIPPVTFPIPRD
jgi:predicted nuclease of predicted toxin-antitoxin system